MLTFNRLPFYTGNQYLHVGRANMFSISLTFCTKWWNDWQLFGSHTCTCIYYIYIIIYSTLYSHFLFFRYELYSSNQHRFQEEATRQLVGSVVLTRYNNRTYRIDDLAWDKNPQSTFIDHTGKAITFIEYYKYGNYN